MWTRWVKERGFKRAALITENTDYGVGLVDETKKAFASLYPGAELKTIIFDRAVVDLTPQRLAIKNWKPDVLFNGGIGTPMYLIAKQAWDVGLTPSVPTLISYDAPSRPEYWKNLGEKGNFASFIVYYHSTMKLTTRGEAFRKKYMAEFKEDPIYGALNGYSQVVLIAEALRAQSAVVGRAPPLPVRAVRDRHRRDLQPDGPRDHVHLQHHEDDQLGDGRVLHDRQLRPVRADREPGRPPALVSGAAAGDGGRLPPGAGRPAISSAADVRRWRRAS